MIGSFWWFLASLLPQVFEKIKDLGMEYFIVRNYWTQVAILEYLYLEGKPTKLGSRFYDGRIVEGIGSDYLVESWESLGPCFRLFTFPNNTFVIASMEDKGSNNVPFLKISYPRFFIDPDEFVRDALLRFQESRQNKNSLINRSESSFVMVSGEGIVLSCAEGGYDLVESPRKILWQPEKHPRVSKLNIKELPLNQEQEEVVNEVEKWVASFTWYRERKIPWRRGYLLYGVPGTGKTTFVKAIASHLNISVYSWDLSTFSNDSFRSQWRNMCPGKMRICLLEDLDTVFNGRENISVSRSSSFRSGESHNSYSGLGWECLLSVLDGAEASEGVLLFATTNRPELLDNSFANVVDGKVQVRPGRVDKAVYFGSISKGDIYEVANRILRDEKKAQEIADSMQSATVADVQEACVKRALSDFWDPHTP